jgi:hypothetical protein
MKRELWMAPPGRTGVSHTTDLDTILGHDQDGAGPRFRGARGQQVGQRDMVACAFPRIPTRMMIGTRNAKPPITVVFRKFM